MNYQESIDFLYSNLPVFHRDGSSAYKPGLQNIVSLCALLGNPQHNFKSIHVAGTNGKGSTCSMLASVLQAAGYKTGLYTSPHIKRFSERIRVNGLEIAENDVAEFVTRHLSVIKTLRPSFFEITVALAFDYFSKVAVDVAIIEVGVGGRLDSTNVISPILSIITNISFDHKDLLGDTLVAIAGEKAGIIKFQTPVIINELQAEVQSVFELRAAFCKAPLYWASERFSVIEDYRFSERYCHKIYDKVENTTLDICTDMAGMYQSKNIVGVCQAIVLLNKMGFKIPQSSVEYGLSNVSLSTGLKGRWQIIQNKPVVVADVGHNEGGILESIRQIESGTYNRLHFILGFVKDKDVVAILKLFPTNASYYFCEMQIERGLSVDELRNIASTVGLTGEMFDDVNVALNCCLESAGQNDFVYIGGSTFLLSDLSVI